MTNHPVLKITVNNVLSLWFGVDTPIRRYKIKLNPELWTACQGVYGWFVPPSGASYLEHYRQSDRIAFAKAVIQEMTHESDYFL